MRSRTPQNIRFGTPDTSGTVFLVVMLLVTAVVLQGDRATTIAFQGAMGVGVGLTGLALLELRHTWRNMFRADLMAFVALYFLTFFEFWFDQPAFNQMVSAEATMQGTLACLWGFGGLAVGRHIRFQPSKRVLDVMHRPASPRLLMIVFWFCLIVGYFYMLLSVNFDIFYMVEAMMAPRFTQPWGRGKFGDWRALLYELNMLLYLIPPLAGVILARRGRYSSGQVLGVMLGFLFTLFRGFASGTRNLFGAYLLTFLVGYCFALPPHARKRALTALGIGGGLMFWATRIMLRIRTEGVSGILWGNSTGGVSCRASFSSIITCG